jgi:hypothetical protein
MPFPKNIGALLTLNRMEQGDQAGFTQRKSNTSQLGYE